MMVFLSSSYILGNPQVAVKVDKVKKSAKTLKIWVLIVLRIVNSI